jgi:hypothetical protein
MHCYLSQWKTLSTESQNEKSIHKFNCHVRNTQPSTFQRTTLDPSPKSHPQGSRIKKKSSWYLLSYGRKLENVERLIKGAGTLADVDNHGRLASPTEEVLEQAGQTAVAERNDLLSANRDNMFFISFSFLFF